MTDSSQNSATGQSKPAGATTGEGIKDTLESILIAFILAFVFRAFVVEAFVIPSGSMAPTLMGAHMRLRCQECGYAFDVNYPCGGDADQTPPSAVGQGIALPMHCPNCGFKVPKRTDDHDNSATSTPVHYGDRILVLKYLYLLREPRRWDVVVFKSPVDPKTYDYSQNYIKRLVGKPGESLMVLDGDVYVSDNWVPGKQASDARWEVQGKPRVVQDALWRIVYDNDYYPRNHDRIPMWQQPWKQVAGGGWDTGSEARTGRLFTFRNPHGAGTLAFDKDINQAANPGVYPLTDWLPYNEVWKGEFLTGIPFDHETYTDGYNDHLPRWYVSDLMVRFFYRRTEGAGPLKVAMTKLGHEFTAAIYPDHAAVLHRHDGKEEQIGEVPLEPSGGQGMKIEFLNVDYQVTLRIDGQDRLRTTAQQYHPDLADLLDRHVRRQALGIQRDYEALRQQFPPPRIEITGQEQTAQVSHLSLWRDVYYTPSPSPYGRENARATPTLPVRLARKGIEGAQEDEYFVMGDNSILSLDARNWGAITPDRIHLPDEDLEVDAGRVPGRFLLGKALFVYWPAGYRPFGVNSVPGLVPNFGDMRFIH